MFPDSLDDDFSESTNNSSKIDNIITKTLQEVTLSDLGKLKQAKITKDTTTIIAKNTNYKVLEERKTIIIE